jgi:hypothetical protein
MSFLPRLHQAPLPRSGSADGDVKIPGPDEEANLAIVSGVIVEEPVKGRSRDGDPITVLLMAFTAPDKKSRRGAACCEVEIPESIATRQRKQLRAGGRLVVMGQLTGAGGIWATAIVTGESTRRPS